MKGLMKSKRLSDKQSYTSVGQFFFSHIIRHKYKCLAMSVLNVFWGASEAITPFMLKLLLDTLSGHRGPRYDIGTTLWWILGGLIGSIIVKNIVVRATDLLTEAYICPQIQSDIRLSMMAYAMRHSYRYYQRNLSGGVTNKINQVAESFLEIYEAWEHWIMPVIWSFVFSVILLWQTHVYCALFVIAWLSLSVGLSLLLSVKGVPYSKDHAKKLNILVASMVNILQNIFTVKMFARHKNESRYLEKLQKKEIEATQRLEWLLAIIRSVLSASSIILLASLGVFLIKGWQRNMFTVGDVTFVLTTCFSMLHTIWWISSHIAKLYKHIGIASQSFSVMTKPHDVVDIPKAKPLKVAQGKIELKNVTFRYEKDAAIFKKMNVTIEPGEKVGLVGFSGCGKTTFVHLIMRFFDIASGTISIDGQDISQVKQSSLRRAIALIPQEPMLFSRPLKDNVMYGNPKASDKDIEIAMTQAHADRFVRRLRHGYNTIVGERGSSMSGGQRQRVAIARAILKDAPILILDEATSALDAMTEKKIQESLDELMENRTAIVIAHRLATIQNMDRLLVFNNGEIIEEGTHDELVKKGGHYAAMWALQVGGVIPDTVPEDL